MYIISRAVMVFYILQGKKSYQNLFIFEDLLLHKMLRPYVKCSFHLENSTVAMLVFL
jgi:hypothetical protein